MIEQQRLIGAIIVVIVIVLMVITRNPHSDVYNDYMYGYWVADGGFCEESDISSMMIFIGESESASWNKVSRNAYLIINNDITNQSIVLKHKPIRSFTTKPSRTISKYKINVDIEFSDDDVDIDPSVVMEFDIKTGTMRMYNNDTIYGIFYKDHEVTNLYDD